MYTFDNIYFADKLPDEIAEVKFLKLLKLKSIIDNKLKVLESKAKIADFNNRLAKEEQSPRYIKANVYFSLS